MSNSIAPGSSADVNVRVTALTTNPNVSVQYKTVILKKNLVNGVNTLTQAMMNQTNTKYVIKYDYTLGEDITVPSGCILEFDGGSISNTSGNLFTINFNSCYLYKDYKLIDIVFAGNIANDKILISDKHVGVSSADISDIVNSIIANTSVKIVEFEQSYTNLTKAIRVERNNLTIQGTYKTITLKNPTLDTTKAETFYFEGNDSITAIATIVIGKANTRLSGWCIRNITIQTMDSWEEIAANQYGVIISGTHWNISDCTIQGNTAGIKGYGVFCAWMKNVIAQSINGAAFDFSEFAGACNGTTMVVEECYAINSNIGYSFNSWYYSTLISLACDNSSSVAYKFNNCTLDAISLGAEDFKGSFIELNASKIRVINPNLVDYMGCNGTLKTSGVVDAVQPAFIKMTHTNATSGAWSSLVIENLSYYKYGMTDSTLYKVIDYKFKYLDIAANCLLEFKNCVSFDNESYDSSVLGAFHNDKLIIGTPDRFYGVDSFSFSKKNGWLNVIGSPILTKDIKNVVIDNINPGSTAVNVSDHSPLLQNCENVTIKNCYISISNTKLFADNTIQKNVVFDNCTFIVSSAAFNTITNSTIVFKNCSFQFDDNYTTAFIAASNSDIVIENCSFKKRAAGDPWATTYTGKFIDGTNSKSIATRPAHAMIGDTFYDTTIEKPIWYKGNGVWIDANGNDPDA